MTNYTVQINQLRKSIIADIKSLMSAHNVRELEIHTNGDEACSIAIIDYDYSSLTEYEIRKVLIDVDGKLVIIAESQYDTQLRRFNEYSYGTQALDMLDELLCCVEEILNDGAHEN